VKTHQYHTTLRWTGNTGAGTISYRGYERAHLIAVEGKPTIEGSSDPSFRGDKTKYNPEEMFVASLSSCHMLWFLHFCTESADGNGRFSEVILKPRVQVKEQWMIEKTGAIHDKAHHFCFIANSCNFPVRHEATASLTED
jgi:organic hydroperoxide reductase OsmC/OhrA